MKKIPMFLIIAFIIVKGAIAQTFELDSVTYQVISIEPCEVRVKDFNSKLTGTLIIPEMVINDNNVYSVTEIGPNVFKMKRILSLIIGDSVRVCHKNAFFYAWGLTSITIGKSVSEISIGGSMEYCPYLNHLNVHPDNKILSSFDGVLYNKNFTVLLFAPPRRGPFEFASSVTYIGADSFAGSDLSTVTIPNSVITIGKSAFIVGISTHQILNSNSRLSSITIGSSVTSIGEWAFAGCNLSQIVSYAIVPPAMANVNAVFWKVDRTIPLLVPPGSVDLYKSDSQWSAFTNISSITYRELVKSKILTILPNPVIDNFTLGGINYGDLVSIYDCNGKVVFSGTAQSEREVINTDYLPSGVYMVKVVLNGKIEVSKFVKP